MIEFAPVLMAEQLDPMGGDQLRRKIERMGVKVHTGKTPRDRQRRRHGAQNPAFRRRQPAGSGFHRVLHRHPRPDKLARQCGLEIGRRGGIAINDCCQTSDPDVYAIGECRPRDRTFGWWRCYKMAQAADHLLGRETASGRRHERQTETAGRRRRRHRRCPRPHRGRPQLRLSG